MSKRTKNRKATVSRIPHSHVGLTSGEQPNAESPDREAFFGGLSTCSDWIVWQLMDSSFPTGGFAHSSGLEAAWQHGDVRGRDDLLSFIEAGLHQLGHASLPFVVATFDQPESLIEHDKLCDAFTANHVANRASRAQGRAMLTAVKRIFKTENRQWNNDEPPCAHFAPIFGVCLQHLRVSRATTGQMFVFNQLRGTLAAAVRLNIVGPMEAQILLHRLFPAAEKVVAKCEHLTLDEIAQTAPLLDLWQGGQDRLYSRLFQS